MEKQIYAIYDSKAECYKYMSMYRGRGEAIREFAKMANDKQFEVGQSPADFTLFYLGTWEDTTGMIKSAMAKEALGTANEYQKETIAKQVLTENNKDV